MSIVLEAIVLKSFDYQDHHKIVKMISPSHGLISVFVSYANKKKSRYRAIAEALTCVNITVRESNEGQGGLYYLVHGDIIDSYYDWKMDYQLIMMFYEMAEIIIKGDIESLHLPHVYRTLKAVLNIAATDGLKIQWGVVAFKGKMLIATGITPAFNGCVSCGGVKKIVTASVSEGGLICEDCYTGDGIWLKTDFIPLWRALFMAPMDRLLALGVTKDQVEALECWMLAYLEGYSNIKFMNRSVLSL